MPNVFFQKFSRNTGNFQAFPYIRIKILPIQSNYNYIKYIQNKINKFIA